MPGKNRNFSQFEGPGRAYVRQPKNERTRALAGLGGAQRPNADRATEINSATADLDNPTPQMEISNPYIGGNKVVDSPMPKRMF